MNIMGDYHDLYLKTHVLLSAHVFEKTVSTCLKNYALDPCHYFSSSELNWETIFKMIEIKLDLISDIDMYLFIEKKMRGGISSITKRYSKANNKYMQSNDNKKSIFHI